MSFKTSIETFFYIGLNKLSLCVFDGLNKKIFEKEDLINNNLEKENLNDLQDKFFGENIINVEKKIGKFINEINLIILNPNFILIQASIKKNGKGDKIKKKDLSHMLFDLKQQIKENNTDKTITHMKINNFLIDKKRHFTLNDNFQCNELCLQVDFVCLSKDVIDDVSNKIKKYQISIDKIFSAKYLNEHHNIDDEDECHIAARLKYENDENEVHLIKKTVENPGFFERFFRFFN